MYEIIKITFLLPHVNKPIMTQFRCPVSEFLLSALSLNQCVSLAETKLSETEQASPHVLDQIMIKVTLN